MKKKEKKQLLIVILILIASSLMTGCSNTMHQEKRNKLKTTLDVGGNNHEADLSKESNYEEKNTITPEDISAVCKDICDDALEKNTSGSLEVIRSIVERLGECGYAAVDSDNQIDMVCPEQIRQFCRKVNAREEAKTELIVVISGNSFIKYEFTAKDGNVEVESSHYLYKGGSLETVSNQKYLAYTWVYSGGEYLFFEEYHMPGFDGPSGHTAVRVEPLKERCRELNRKYLRTIGYKLNNLFTSDWSEEDFGELNFYDLYEALYRMKDRQYVSIELFEQGINYEIPKSEFENVFQTFFQIDSQSLQQYTIYHEDTETYRYRARGVYDFASTPYIPYPEVTAYEENQDGTIKLTVKAVWPEKNLENVFSHEVVIRPLEDGGFQYVSNHVIPSAKNVEITWYTERLSDDEWQEYYGGITLDAEEEQRLQSEAVSAAKQCMEFYKDVEVECYGTDYSRIRNFSDDKRKSVVRCLGKQGLVSVSDDINMENYQKMEEFYSEFSSGFSSGADAMVTVFNVNKDGNIGAVTFIHRSGKIQSYHVSIGWREGGIPEIKKVTSNKLKEIKMTEKGYFIYTYAETFMHGNLREYFRVKPLSDECREMTKKYIYGLSYVNYNMLVTNWDAGNVEEILMPCMFEDIYRIYTGEEIKTEKGQIPAEIYERIMTTCFPVSVEQVRENCGYHADTGSYEYEMIFPRQYPPFGEVVDYKKNIDGTITLYVDGVWVDYNSDCAFTNTIVVQPFDDGTFRYLSNSIEQKELEVPKIRNVSCIDRQIENGYDLPVSDDEKEEAETDCKKMMELMADIYKDVGIVDASNDTLSDEALYEMTEKIKETGNPVRTNKVYSNMENYERFENFLISCTEGNGGTEIIYEIHFDGTIGREKYICDGNAMYVVASNFTWGNDGKSVMSYISYAQIKEWKYTDKGWFCYELCVPEYPEVTEVVDGSCLIRVKPMSDENRKMSEKCVLGLAYQGNNLLCSNWDTAHMKDLDYNGLYEYLYAMKYGKKFDSKKYLNGIPKKEFEELIMEYLPITEEDIQRYAVFDVENQTYEWAELGCFNYTPDYFGTSFPEVTDIRKNGDGTVTLTVDAVCEFMLCDDAVITHELTVRFSDDGSFKYLENKILNNGISDIPAYEYRISSEKQ